MRHHAQCGGSRSHLRSCHRPLSYTGRQLPPPWPSQSCLSSAHFYRSKPPPQADAGQFTQKKAAEPPYIPLTLRATNKGQELIFLSPKQAPVTSLKTPMPALPIPLVEPHAACAGGYRPIQTLKHVYQRSLEPRFHCSLQCAIGTPEAPSRVFLERQSSRRFSPALSISLSICR